MRFERLVEERRRFMSLDLAKALEERAQ